MSQTFKVKLGSSNDTLLYTTIVIQKKKKKCKLHFYNSIFIYLYLKEVKNPLEH